MAAAARTHFLDPDHSITGIAQAADVRLIVGFEEARPSRARVELRARTEERQPAEAARVDPVTVIVEKDATEGGLGPVLEQYAALIRSEARGDLRALCLSRRSQVELAHHAPWRVRPTAGKLDCRADHGRWVTWPRSAQRGGLLWSRSQGSVTVTGSSGTLWSPRRVAGAGRSRSIVAVFCGSDSVRSHDGENPAVERLGRSPGCARCRAAITAGSPRQRSAAALPPARGGLQRRSAV